MPSCPDVQIADPTNGQQLTYSTPLNQWHNTIPSSMTTSLGALTDCSISDPVTNNFLQYNGTVSYYRHKWANCSRFNINVIPSSF